MAPLTSVTPSKPLSSTPKTRQSLLQPKPNPFSPEAIPRDNIPRVAAHIRSELVNIIKPGNDMFAGECTFIRLPKGGYVTATKPAMELKSWEDIERNRRAKVVSETVAPRKAFIGGAVVTLNI